MTKLATLGTHALYGAIAFGLWLALNGLLFLVVAVPSYLLLSI
jgi:hypothetical protein